jgi:tripartite-type tricarboxylate transporter receptor subunit TctC
VRDPTHSFGDFRDQRRYPPSATSDANHTAFAATQLPGEKLLNKIKYLHNTLLLALALTPHATQAQPPQAKPIRLVIGFPAGGPLDVAARILTPHMSEYLGQQVIVDNRAGANGIIGTEIVATAPPDGRTMLFGATGNFAINPAPYANLPFSIQRDFAPVSHVASTLSLIYAVGDDKVGTGGKARADSAGVTPL